MKTNKGPITVQSFHYDMANPSDEVKQEIHVSIEHPELKDENGNPMDETKGKIYQVIVPFEIHPQGAPFKVSGLIGQVLQLIDFHDNPEDLKDKEVQQISRECVEYIETLTYQVTAVTLNQGVSLNFTAEDSVEPNENVKKLREKKNKKD
ncbi:DUF1149 family protein [Companilactobacillus sp.]|jgi:hypothetical protein|uniref:DUF1149 family protein n=1 Tax=Companilactobacillus sp. TaxID=2767905 RepID=UPI0025C0D500|nr:DUF1149 family protein [Companilactobacillus sp.]MCH4008818.1 DUF1149 family protein [Companilactobacillus sp.]MCH4051003.1 DUF1149 family protein [Companilactobacillus sp.]MCH4076761.1 DUF1149 family protein [Companilactobacillus sp.]MCH4125336.1 DUF1149 family protein [Companilactobacillus sp.]MCH4131876.1 DUF1149 family protein [Companilactobacillus sp.]